MKLGGMSDLCIDERDYNFSDEFPGNNDAVVPDSAYEDGGSDKDVEDMTLEDTKILNHGFNSGHVDVVENFCTADPMLCDSSAATHGGVYNYSLDNIPEAENNLGFLDNGEKEGNDLLYGWGDIGNFEDVDKMLRSCDSAFGLDSLNNEDDMYWLSSAEPNENIEAAMTDDKKPDIMFENHKTPMLQVEDFLNNSESNHAVEDEYGYTIVGGSAQGKPSENVTDTRSQKKDRLMLDEEANLEKKQTNHLHHLNGKSDGYSENSFILQHNGISRQLMDTNPFYPPSAFQQPSVPYSNFNCEQSSDQVSACDSKSGIKTENNTNPSSASNESYTSNQAQSVESLQGPTVDDRCRKGFEKRVNLQHGQAMPPSFGAITRKSSKTNPKVFVDDVPAQKIGLENDHRKALETSNMQESSCVSSVVDDISLEATSFRQFQQVIEQLDVRTKLCIRDSLYRLAKSAEQRHSCINPNVENRQEKGAGSQLVTGESDKYVGFMDIETDTNPIDRTIAHLLFHRPSDSSLSSVNDVLSYKSHPVIPHSSPSLRIEKQEETPEPVPI